MIIRRGIKKQRSLKTANRLNVNPSSTACNIASKIPNGKEKTNKKKLACLGFLYENTTKFPFLFVLFFLCVCVKFKFRVTDEGHGESTFIVNRLIRP